MRTKKNFVSLLFCILLLFFAVPAAVYAAETTEEHRHDYEEAGKCSSCDFQAEAVVTVTDKEPVFQDTIEAAINYAKGKTGAVIKVLSNLEVNTKLSFDEGSFTLDLNGKTISSPEDVVMDVG